ncbi:MAG: 6,7-dimethyl-8-ribityllumazine synthase, partial [Thermoanaerobaculia bacterium]
GKRFAVVASRFNERIVERLVTGAVDCLRRHGVQEIELVRVPGAWEIAAALEELAAAGRHDALIALGAVVRGETPHFDFLCAEASRGIARVAGAYRVPVGFGLLTCDTTEQAEERSGGKAGNKGREAALAALEMADVLRQLRSREQRGTGTSRPAAV